MAPGLVAGREWATATLLGLLLVLSACESNPPSEPEPSPPLASLPDHSGYGAFSSDAAWGHLESLAKIGPRVSGTPGSKRAQQYLHSELAKIGAGVTEYRFEADLGGQARGSAAERVGLVDVVGVLPGESEDVFLLAAPYDTADFDSFRFVGANSGASGPALLLELGRVLASRPRPYTVWLAFLDGDSLDVPGSDSMRFVGSELLSQQWAESGVLEQVRFAVFFDRVADADLVIARDLWSHSVYRDLFWESARDLGYGAEFAEGSFESPATGHRAFLNQRFRRVVALVDNRYGAGEPPGSYWRSEDDTPKRCSPDSLGLVGQVTLEALHKIGLRLEKIDRFARSPF